MTVKERDFTLADMAEHPVLVVDPDAWHQSVVITPLLAAARSTYAVAVRQALTHAGFEDVPARGPFVLGAVANHGSTLSEAVAGLRVSKQAASQLVDTLVSRGYLERTPDPGDRRRVTVTLTDRGRAAAIETRDAVAGVDAALVERVGADAVATARAVLGAMVQLAEDPHLGRQRV